jgi:hypothetical protein
MTIPCPECAHPLGLRLHPAEGNTVWCRSCRSSVDYGHLIRSGIPSGLIVKLMEWAEQCPRITGVGYRGDYGPGLSDEHYVHAWREVHQATATLLAAMRWYVDAEAEVETKVFDRPGNHVWTDGDIIEWRKKQIRLRRISDYGGLFGRHYRDMGKQPAPLSEEIPIPYPAALSSPEEREAFRIGFVTRSHVDPFRALDYSKWASEVEELERELGFRPTKKPPGGEVPPGGR